MVVAFGATLVGNTYCNSQRHLGGIMEQASTTSTVTPIVSTKKLVGSANYGGLGGQVESTIIQPTVLPDASKGWSWWPFGSNGQSNFMCDSVDSNLESLLNNEYNFKYICDYLDSSLIHFDTDIETHSQLLLKREKLIANYY